MLSRREALRNIGLAAGSLALAPFARQLRAEAVGDSDKLPKRFVFIVRSNGVLTTEIQPKGLEQLVKTRANGGWQTKQHIYPLADYRLHDAMAPLESLKNRVTIFQGLSGRASVSDHGARYGALGSYKSGKGGAGPRLETIDGALAKALGGVFPHLGFEMATNGKSVTYPSLSAIGPKKPLPFYADPMLAYADLFGTVAKNATTKASLDIDRNVLDFMIDDIKRFKGRLSSREREKLDHYLHGFEAMHERQAKLVAMNNTLAKVAPELRDHYTSEINLERLKAHFDLVAASLIGGLTNIATIRADNLSMRLDGLGLEAKTVHELGHMIEGKKGGGGGAPFENGMGEFATRAVIMKFHMELIAGLAAKLAAVPEGEGTMLDNTLILYLSDHGDRHHAKHFEWPMVALGNVNGQLKAGHYVQVPGYGSNGHRTIANLYLTLLHTAGHPRDTFGDKDLQLESTIDQTGPLAEWMA